MARAARVVGSLDRRRPPLVDPRDGDVESDESSPERRSLLALAGNLLAEVSLPKMAVALGMLVVLPALLIGIAPPLATMWWSTLQSTRRAGGAGAAFLLAALLAAAWLGWRPFFRIVERSFWALNAMAIQPAYVSWREVLLHLSALVAGGDDPMNETRRNRARAIASAFAGIVMAAISLLVIRLLWPATHWVGTLNDLRTPHWLALTALANAAVVGAAYLAVAAVWWGVADATMQQPTELTSFRSRNDFVRSWRIAHLSDIHVVGERYGFRLGSGRAGPRGNEHLVEALRRLDEMHRRQPLDAIVVTGDLTDAGTSAEWAELLDAFNNFPSLATRLVALPGNHDLNVVDRANPARLDLPTSPKKQLRQVRTLSALAALQGSRVRVAHARGQRVGGTVEEALAPSVQEIIEFADRGSRRLAKRTDGAWTAVFPMVLPPFEMNGLGIIALNSNAETHFSFTNALGLVPLEQVRALDAAMEAYPQAVWIVALHHHIVEHPKLGNALSTRIGTTLINGNWFTRHLRHVADRTIVMHGHRHIDWMGRCGGLVILSAPSAVMPENAGDEVYFYVHTLGVDASGRIGIAEPERVDVRPVSR
jgi:Calcineurin-like phosphoesterase